VDLFVGVPLLAWAASGLAAVALVPRNPTARALCAAGTLLPVSWFLENAAADLTGPSAIASLARAAAEATFLGGLAAAVWVLATYPAGTFQRVWHRSVALLMAGLALLGPLAQLLGSSSLRVGGEPSTEVRNVMVADVLGPLGVLGNLVIMSEPAWLLLGFAMLAQRWLRSGPDQRRDLRWPLLSLLLLAVLLVVLVVSSMAGLEPPYAVFDRIFLVALALFPVTLLVGVAHRTRTMEQELAASRTRLVEAEDRARREVERDLHDGVQQQLVAILSLTELAARQVSRDPLVASRTLEDVRRQTHAAIADLRELVHGIRPPVLEDSGVAAAIESRLSSLPDEVTLDVEAGRDLRWPPETEAAAYFVICEAVTNALKHAPGSRVHVSVCCHEGSLRVTVTDDGPGLRSADLLGRGLEGLRDRVESLGGVFEVVGASGPGTTVRATFPQPVVVR
jgi:signal transduction histidine kinase